MRRTMTARQRLAVFANVSRMQSDQETYDMAVNRDVELKRQRVRAERAEAERDAWQLSCRNAERARDEAIAHRDKVEAERDALVEQLNSVTSMAERFGQERDALLALLRECHDRFIDAYSPDGRFTRKIGAALDAARKEGEG